MKMEYIKPKMEETLLDTEVLMLSASNEPADDTDGLSNGRRGTWGNLWSEGEE